MIHVHMCNYSVPLCCAMACPMARPSRAVVRSRVGEGREATRVSRFKVLPARETRGLIAVTHTRTHNAYHTYARVVTCYTHEESRAQPAHVCMLGHVGLVPAGMLKPPNGRVV